VRVTATWHKATLPVAPQYWRAAPTQSADAVGRRLHVGSLVHDQDRVAPVPAVLTVQLPDCPVPGCIQHCPVVAAGARQQVLHRARAGEPSGLGEGPAIVIIEFGQQAVHHATAGQPRLPAGEARRDPRHQVIEQARVPVMVHPDFYRAAAHLVLAARRGRWHRGGRAGAGSRRCRSGVADPFTARSAVRGHGRAGRRRRWRDRRRRSGRRGHWPACPARACMSPDGRVPP
jgi:hypothetical protein